MGKRIIMQRRGRGGNTYRASKRAYVYKIQVPANLTGEGKVVSLFNSKAHSAPLAKIQYTKDKKVDYFFIPAAKNMYEGQVLSFDGKIENGNVVRVKDVDPKTPIYCIESRPGDGGKFMKTGGSSAMINRVVGESVFVMLPSKKEKKLNGNCRAIVGVVAGHGRLDKPVVKAGKKYYMKKAKSKLWPRTSACKMNAIDHPFGSGRGKVPKPRIAKRNSAPGQKVGLIRPKRTGKRK